MNYIDHEEMLSMAQEHFKDDEYAKAEPILNQLVLKNTKSPDVFHMLGTIFYENGKFSKAIRSFKRALELDPTFTDASVGLSIILNDLGRYDEGKKVFEDAKKILDESKVKDDPYINEKLATKHDELADIYFRYGRYKEALEQFYKTLSLSSRKAETSMRIVECYLHLNDFTKAIKTLEDLIRIVPDFTPARIRLGQLYKKTKQISKALQQWENVLARTPDHPQAQKLLNETRAKELSF